MKNETIKRYNEIDSNEIDRLKKKCEKCKKGTYQEMSIHDDLEGKVTCNKCKNRVNRYITTD